VNSLDVGPRYTCIHVYCLWWCSCRVVVCVNCFSCYTHILYYLYTHRGAATSPVWRTAALRPPRRGSTRCHTYIYMYICIQTHMLYYKLTVARQLPPQGALQLCRDRVEGVLDVRPIYICIYVYKHICYIILKSSPWRGSFPRMAPCSSAATASRVYSMSDLYIYVYMYTNTYVILYSKAHRGAAASPVWRPAAPPRPRRGCTRCQTYIYIYVYMYTQTHMLYYTQKLTVARQLSPYGALQLCGHRVEGVLDVRPIYIYSCIQTHMLYYTQKLTVARQLSPYGALQLRSHRIEGVLDVRPIYISIYVYKHICYIILKSSPWRGSFPRMAHCSSAATASRVYSMSDLYIYVYMYTNTYFILYSKAHRGAATSPVWRTAAPQPLRRGCTRCRSGNGSRLGVASRRARRRECTVKKESSHTHKHATHKHTTRTPPHNTRPEPHHKQTTTQRTTPLT